MANVGTAAAGKTLIGAGNGSSPRYADIGTNSNLTGMIVGNGNSAFEGVVPLWYGNGQDGSVTFDGSSVVLGLTPAGNEYTLTRDILPTSCTINSGVLIKMNGYRIYCNGTLTNNGTIHSNGNNATLNVAGSTTNSGNVGGAPSSGGNGGITFGTSVSANTNCFNNALGKGGNGGAGASAGGTTSVNTSVGTLGGIFPAMILARNFNNGQFQTSNGGAGGGGDGTNAGGGGGGGGGGVYIIAFKIAGTGTISATGGNGGNGAVAGTNCGGGGGGAGGTVVITSASVSGGSVPGQTVVLTGGTGGTGSGTGANGQNGGSGTVDYFRL